VPHHHLRLAGRVEYLEAGRIRGEYAGYDWHKRPRGRFCGRATGKQRLKDALAKGVPDPKYALPRRGLAPGGHGGSHGYLTDDFIDAILENASRP
jgi:hypothetical protein